MMEKRNMVFRNQLNEEGSALLFAVLMLLLLTLLGIAGTTTTTIDILIAGNYKVHNLAFYASDSGIKTTPKLISTAIDDDTTPLEFSPPVNFGSTVQERQSFYREIMGFTPHDAEPDLMFSLKNNTSVTVDVTRVKTANIVGGGTEFASGAEGIGVGSAGGMAIFYYMDSFGTAPTSAKSNIGAEYRKIVGIRGGL